jgi:hypothetical protein
MPASPPLETLQRWLLRVVVHPGSIEEALSAPEARAENESADDVILPSRSLSPARRIAIYHGMYPARMREALQSDYPALEHCLGPRGFEQLVQEYVQAHPSRSYTLNRLGDHLPEFLKSAGPKRQRAFLAELARLELAVTEVFDAPELPPLGAAQIAAVPLEEWERAVLTTVPAFRLVRSRYNVNDYVQAVKDGRRAPRPRLAPSFVAVYRRDYAVYRQALTRAQHELLADIASGVVLGEAIQAALKRPGPRPEEQRLFRWFRDWVSGGVFASLRILDR